MDYKKTLLLPKTDFPMRGNLGINEIKIQQKWEKINLYSKVLEKNKNNSTFCLHDGPPYANGNIHIGHALNKILKDFILRFKTMNGYKTVYIPGWDTHGLPIEIAVSKKINKNDYSRTDFIKECKKFAYYYIEKQKKQFKRLGILGEWDKPYITLDNIYVSEQIKFFGEMVQKNLIFKDLKPVYYSPSLESVLSEAEIEYYDIKSISIFVSFKIFSNFKNIDQDFWQNSELLIWTTTPWTLPANVAVAVNPQADYNLIKIDNKKYLVGAKNLNYLKKNLDWNNNIEIIKIFKGFELENLRYQNPIVKRYSKIILGEYVSETEGTGLVHIATAHGLEDYLIGKKYNLPIICSVDKKGFMTKVAEKYQGIYYEKANSLIIKDLNKIGLLLKEKKIFHNYPHDARTKKPIIFLAIQQWFISIEKIKKTLLSEIKKVNWCPNWGKMKMHNMIKERQDWAISRQRVWGVPIPIFYDENNIPILDINIINHIASLFAKYGSEIWYEWKIKDLLPEEYIKNKKSIHLFTKEKDIMDVWFDSGTSFNILKIKNQNFPADIYLEGSDQFRGWFNSSLIISTAVYNQSPYKKVITHGFVLDGKGQKMSKSLGNIIDPLKIIEKKGADILRLWIATTNYNIDVRVNENILKQTEEIYRKIRNTFRFMLGNLNNFNPEKNYLTFYERKPIHQVIIIKFNKILKASLEAYEKFQFEKAVRYIHVFLNNEISAFYLDFAKDILYIEKENNLERRMIQSTIYDILIDNLKILTPIIPHTTSEAYQSLSFLQKKEDIYLELMPKIKKFKNIDNIEKSYEIFCSLKEIVFKQLEKSIKNKIINNSLQAKLLLELTDEYLLALKILKIENNLHQLFIVSQINIKTSLYNNVNVEVSKALGNICPRCWNIIYNKKNIDDLCIRCFQNINDK
ncbi:MAG: isoleucine--tRNA ligase [Candidatus Phytoplasma pyri]